MTQPTLFETDSETQQLDELAIVHAELTALRDRHQILLKERSRHDEQVREAARQESHRNALALIAAALPETLHSARQLATAVLALDGRPSQVDLDHAKHLAEQVTTRDLVAGAEAQAVREIVTAAETAVQDATARAGHWFTQSQKTFDEQVLDRAGELRAAGWTSPAWMDNPRLVAQVYARRTPERSGTEADRG